MTAVIRLEDVSRSFGQTVAAEGVSFEVQQGEIFGLLGHNGAGKTTLIRLVNGLLVPDRGAIRTLGLDPLQHGNAVRRRTGVLTTYPGLDEYLTPLENLAVFAAIHGLSRAETHRRSVRLLTRLGLDPHSVEPARGLSAGLKQRVALARALVHDPEVLLLDEPTANLDPIAARDVRRLVRELAADGRTILFSTHNLAEAEALCDRVAILRNGRLLAVGSLAELADDRLHRGVRISVGHEQGPRAVEAVQPLLNGHTVNCDGDQLLVGGAAPTDVAGLIRVLVDADVDVFEVVPHAPSLEDVYLAIHAPAVTS